MTSINVPEPVMSLAIAPKARDANANFSKALNRCDTPCHSVMSSQGVSASARHASITQQRCQEWDATLASLVCGG